jgi:2-amino-4-hydroxy-6-hydroxymethyldihydropteridine diphosphokinase
MIYIGLGANLPSRFGSPVETLKAAKEALLTHNIDIVGESATWLSAPLPYDPEQDWFHNEVIAIKTSVAANELLHLMLEVEQEFGRVRSVKNAPRLLDMDLIAYHDEIIKQDNKLIVPHPRMSERLFVLKPLEELDPNWVHPITGQKIDELIADIGPEQDIKKL